MAELTDEDYIDELSDLKNKLEDFLNHVNNGKRSYFKEIALKLRILFIKKSRRDPLITVLSQRFNFDFNVWITYTLEEAIDRGKASESLRGLIDVSFQNNALDWLENKGDEKVNIIEALNRKNQVQIDGNAFSFRQIIEVLADKKGAHIDPDMPDSHAALHSSELLLSNLTLAERVIYDTARQTIKILGMIQQFIENGTENDFIKRKLPA